MDVREQLIANEKALLTEAVRHSREKLRALISENFQEVGASGERFGIGEVLERCPQERGWVAQAWNFECRMLGPGLGQVQFQCVVTSSADSDPVYSLRSSLWRLEGRLWKMVFHQGTKTAPFDVESAPLAAEAA